MKTIVSLCDYSGVWSAPYAHAGYRVIQVDVGFDRSLVLGNVSQIKADVREWTPDIEVHGVLAAPPCCCFCRPGARWWPRMDEQGDTAEAMEVMQACFGIAKRATGWWAIENPPGRHMRLMPNLPKPSWQYQPWWYGDDWTKQTYIWGNAVQPAQTHYTPPKAITYRTPNGRTQGRVSRMSSSWKREREKTPSGFAQAFFRANP